MKNHSCGASTVFNCGMMVSDGWIAPFSGERRRETLDNPIPEKYID
ncbi:MAG: hypothetical protein IPK57_15585 [Chitinophagaceae bacterium]|nr:hypothetical protein [Chitinophagaceae bacterium]